MTENTGFGVVGCGMIGQVHAEAIASIPSARLVAVYSRDLVKATSLADRYACAAYNDFDRFLRHPKLEVVNICSPSGLHLDHGVAAAAARKHLLVEKPIEISLQRADRLIEACNLAGVKLGVVFQSRFLDDVRLIKATVEAGGLGNLILGDAYVKWYRSPEYYADSWHGTRALDGGGALINQAIHTVDLLQWIMGPVESVTAMSGALRYPEIEGEDTLVGTIRFRSGALGVVVAATSILPGFKRRLEISGIKGTIILEGDSISVWEINDVARIAGGGEQLTDGSSNPAAIATEGHRRQIEDMMHAVREDREPIINGQEGRKSLAIVEALYRASAGGNEIRL